MAGWASRPEKLFLYLYFEPDTYRVEIRKGTRHQAIESRIRVLCGVLSGEIPMSPIVGTQLPALDFEKMRDLLPFQVAPAITGACAACIPEIVIRGMTVDEDSVSDHTVRVSITYTYRDAPSIAETLDVSIRNWGVRG